MAGDKKVLISLAQELIRNKQERVRKRKKGKRKKKKRQTDTFTNPYQIVETHENSPKHTRKLVFYFNEKFVVLHLKYFMSQFLVGFPGVVHEAPIHVLRSLKFVQLLHQAIVAQDGPEYDVFKCRHYLIAKCRLWLALTDQGRLRWSCSYSPPSCASLSSV